MTGSANAGRRLRQVHDCLKAVGKSKEPKDACVVAGDFNAELPPTSSLVSLLSTGNVEKGFVEDGIAVTNKGKSPPLGTFLPVWRGEEGEETLIAPQLVPRFWGGRDITVGLEEAARRVFRCYATDVGRMSDGGERE